MASCPECGQTISIVAQTCPHCGCHIETYKRLQREMVASLRRERARRKAVFVRALVFAFVITLLALVMAYYWNMGHFYMQR